MSAHWPEPDFSASSITNKFEESNEFLQSLLSIPASSAESSPTNVSVPSPSFTPSSSSSPLASIPTFDSSSTTTIPTSSSPFIEDPLLLAEFYNPNPPAPFVPNQLSQEQQDLYPTLPAPTMNPFLPPSVIANPLPVALFDTVTPLIPALVPASPQAPIMPTEQPSVALPLIDVFPPLSIVAPTPPPATPPPHQQVYPALTKITSSCVIPKRSGPPKASIAVKGSKVVKLVKKSRPAAKKPASKDDMIGQRTLIRALVSHVSRIRDLIKQGKALMTIEALQAEMQSWTNPNARGPRTLAGRIDPSTLRDSIDSHLGFIPGVDAVYLPFVSREIKRRHRK